MDWKRYYFKLEMEQLPDATWHKLKTTDIFKKIGFPERSTIVEQLAEMPEPMFDKLKETVVRIRDREMLQFLQENPKGDEMYLAFAIGQKGWFSAEEDEAWKDL